MSVKLPLSSSADGESIAPLPPYTRLFGPVAARKLGRLAMLYAVCLSTGSMLLLLAHEDAHRIFGLGLMWPGTGFLAHADVCSQSGIGHVAMMLGAGGLFGLSLLIWFGTGNIVAPPLVWLGTALWAASMPHGPLLPGVVQTAYAMLAGALLALIASMLIWHARARRQRAIDNAYLGDQSGACAAIFTAPAASARAEMSLAHLQRLRFALDRALQPLDGFDGFEVRDQFQTAALRYQLNFLGYATALTQVRFTPAFSGYMHEAQRRLIHKQTQHRIWSYWALENLWGNLHWDANPVARENIMFTGFVALQMSLFQASTGRGEFSVPGSFKLTHPAGMHCAFDLPSLLRNLDSEYKRSHFYLIACEPNWVYPLCNTMGACAMLAHDVQRGSSNWADHATAFRAHLEAEFLDASGRYVPCLSARTGLALPAIGGVMPQAMPCYFLNALAPDLARRQWLLLRRQLFDKRGQWRRRAFWPIDTGNYGFSRASAYAATALAAAELGDEAVYTHCMAALEHECPSVLKGGVIHRSRASVWAHGVELMALANGRDGLRSLMAQPHTASGPRLHEVRYPDVLVASAHADARTGALKAVLYGGAADGVPRVECVELAGLRPHWHYRVSGAMTSALQADGAGRAGLRVSLMGRTCLSIEPDGGHEWLVAP